MTSPRIVAVVGNPKPASRTFDLAALLVQRLATALAIPAAATQVVDLAPLGPRLLGWGDPDVGALVQRCTDAQVLVVASPTYKASFTGLLKLLLDQIDAGALYGVQAIPLMTMGGPRHWMAADTQLRPVLHELGAGGPTPALRATEADLADPAELVQTWVDQHAARLVLATAVDA